MSTTSQRMPFEMVSSGVLSRLGAVLNCAWQSTGHALDVWHQRRVLETLDDRMLKDLGITRAQAHYEASRSPWDMHGRV